MKAMNYKYMILAGAVVLFTACQREEVLDEKRSEVTFAVATGYENGPETRTEYSGFIKEVGGSSYERINWVVGDMFRIFSDKAATLSGIRMADYSVTAESHIQDGVESNAIVFTGTPLNWGAGTHTFYGLYPVPGSDGVDAGVSFSESGVATLVLPSDQSSIDMKYAYMGAATTVIAPDRTVNLNFKPLMNAFHFEFYVAEDVDMILKSITLEAMDEGISLTGTYSVDLATDGTYTVGETITGGSHTITATIGEGGAGVPLPKPSSGTPWSKTFFAIPQAISSGLKITLEVRENGVDKTMSLELKDGDAWIAIARGQKMNISTAFAVAWDYTLAHSGATVTLDDNTEVVEIERNFETAGTTNTAVFESYRSIDGGVTKKPVDVTYDFVAADPATGLPLREGGEIAWSSTIPEGMNASNPITISGGSASMTIKSTLLANTFSEKESVNEFLKHAENLKSREAVGSEGTPYDLSMHDIHGTSRSNSPVTANCYIVDRAGWYMFPIVYGNAIDYTKATASGKARELYNNGVNAYAYKDAVSPETNINTLWHNYQNFTGTDLISTPYVLDDVGSLNAHDVEAVVVWQDVESATYSFIENVSVEEVASSEVFFDPKTSSYKSSVPYIKFQVPEGSIDPDETKDPLQRVTGIRQGNAVIAVRLKNAKTIGGTTYDAGTILWSWHIWITDGYDTDGDFQGNGLASIRVTNFQNVNLDMMPVNLGWCDSSTYTTYNEHVWYVRVCQTLGSSDPIIFRVVQKKVPLRTVAGSSGTYYQWGRKDPFIPSIGSENMNKAAFSPSEIELVSSNSAVNTSSAGSVSSSIRHPYTFYTASSGTPYNLWNMAYTDLNNDEVVSKTVFDPCPPGYSVPRRNSFTGFTTNGVAQYSVTNFNVVDYDGNGTITAGDFDRGWYFYTNSSKTATIFFPAAGCRSNNNGREDRVGGYGYYFSAARNSNSNGCHLNFYQYNLSPLGNSSVFLGTAIRPVQEQ